MNKVLPWPRIIAFYIHQWLFADAEEIFVTRVAVFKNSASSAH